MTTLAAHEVSVRFGEVVAVDGVSLELAAGDSLGLVGESGSGKTSLARALCGLRRPDAGAVTLDGAPLAGRDRARRRAVQLVFQDPFQSLNPRRTVGGMLRELLRAHRLAPGRERARSVELIERVGLPPAALDRYPAAFSGGQRQRIAIARALAVEPQIVLADEPVSALDVSVQATVLAVFDDLRARQGIGLLLISHNLAVVRALCDTVAVMYLGRIVELAPRDELFADPRHPYTRALIDAVPRLGATPDAARRDGSAAAAEGPADPQAVRRGDGCAYAPACPLAQEICRREDPALLPVGAGPRRSACHFRDRPRGER